MKFNVVEVSPALAELWLKKNGLNRKVNKAHVKQISKQMTAGNWVLNGQTIAFDANGRLIDGQHRLNAVIDSGVTVTMSVALGVEDSRAFKMTDVVSLKRGAHQVAAMMGVKKANRVTAVARIIMKFEQSATVDGFLSKLTSGGNRDAMPDAISEKAVQIESEVEDIEESIGLKVIAQSAAPASLLAALIILNRTDPINMETFCRKIKTGIVDGENDPCLRLRDKLIAGKGKMPNYSWNIYVMAITIKSFVAHQKGKGIKVLRWRVGGDAPEAFPAIPGGKQ